MTLRTDHPPADPAAHSPGRTDHLQTALHSGAGPGSVVINALSLPVDAHAFGAEGAAPGPVRLEVIPPPGPDGVLPAADGRVQRVRDVAQLAAALNAQAHAARIDRDHRSEPSSKTFAGTTEAEGWLSHYTLNARGGISADAELDAELVKALRAKRYRYLSPALLLDAADDVVGLSSVAFVNNPNLSIQAPRVNSGTSMNENELKAQKADLDARETKIAEREAAATKLLENAAEQAVDAAIAANTILPAQKDYHLGAIKTHAGGIEKGIEAFNAFAGSGTGSDTQNASKVLTQRVAPRGQPPTGSAQAPAYPVPNGWAPPSEDRLALHAKIAEYAQKRGIPYAQAITEFGANHGI